MILQRTLDAVGIHGSAVRCIPIFAVYLAVLVHTFNLARVKVLPPFPGLQLHALQFQKQTAA